MKLNQLRDNPGARQDAMRVGRGVGSGKGKTCGRGGKGQKGRTGVSIKAFEGGQSPLLRRMPKTGFNNFTAKEYAVVTLDTIQNAIDTGLLDASKPVDVATLVAVRLAAKAGDGLRLIAGKKAFKAKANFVVTKASAGAIEIVQKAGGKVEVLPVKENKLLKPGKEPKREKRKEAGIARIAKRRANIGSAK